MFSYIHVHSLAWQACAGVHASIMLIIIDGMMKVPGNFPGTFPGFWVAGKVIVM